MAENTTPPELDHNWDFEVNLSGVQAPTGKGAANMPEGYYGVDLTDLYVNLQRNPNRVVIKAQVNEGPYKGGYLTTGLGKPKSDDDKVRHYWRALAESAGYTTKELDSGAVKFGLSTFKGRKAFVRFTPAAGEGTFPEIVFLAPAEWKLQAAAFEGSGESAPSTSTGNNGAAPAKTKTDVLKQLGIS